MRVAIYGRVSTDDKGQDPENQLRQLREWYERMGYPIVREYVEHESGGKGVEYRKQLGGCSPPRHGASSICCSYGHSTASAVKAWPRRSFTSSVSTRHGIGFRSFTEEHLSTENELVRNILLALLASLAKLERQKISQRTKASLERARAKGKVLGRPKFSDGDREKLRIALDTGESWHAVSKKTRIPYATVKKHARAMGYKPRRSEPARRRNS
jgi:DNA invertase Pin-like site-specific DNA recombinase